jgi:hypothetical protein
MSVRAHRIIKIEYADYPSFNLWHDEPIMDFLSAQDGFQDFRNEDGNGTIEFPAQALVDLLASDIALEVYHKEAFEKDIQSVNGNMEEYIEYSCY